jgi:hypothetical protein
MERKAKLVNFDEKDQDEIALSKRLTHLERIHRMFELIELSYQLRSKDASYSSKKDDLPFIVLKKRQDAIS